MSYKQLYISECVGSVSPDRIFLKIYVMILLTFSDF